ncbi:MAG: hypothetical protein JNL82_38560 [Myxococcales bacterium]|nr:hypothetical protein [Myxococcales bacterium]
MATGPEIETLWSSDEAAVTFDRRLGIVRFIRSAAPLPELAVFRALMLELVARLDGLARAELGLIVDTRLAIGRSDDAFEAMMNEFRPRLFGGFRRVAVLIKTAVGRLQVQRLARADNLVDRMLVTGDEAEAVAFARRT